MMLTGPGSDRFASMVEHTVGSSRTVRWLEVITTMGGRRRWPRAERRRIFAGTGVPGAVVSVVAALRNKIGPQHMFAWLRDARKTPTAQGSTADFAPVFLDEPASASTESLPGAGICPHGSPAAGIKPEMSDAVECIGAQASGAQIAAVIRALRLFHDRALRRGARDAGHTADGLPQGHGRIISRSGPQRGGRGSVLQHGLRVPLKARRPGEAPCLRWKQTDLRGQASEGWPVLLVRDRGRYDSAKHSRIKVPLIR